MVYAIYKYQTYQFIVLIVQEPSLMVKGYHVFFSTLDKDRDYL